MLQPNWFDMYLAGSGADLTDAAQIAAAIAKSPRVLAAIQRGIEQAKAGGEQGKIGPSAVQCIRRELSAELQATS